MVLRAGGGSRIVLVHDSARGCHVQGCMCAYMHGHGHEDMHDRECATIRGLKIFDVLFVYI